MSKFKARMYLNAWFHLAVVTHSDNERVPDVRPGAREFTGEVPEDGYLCYLRYLFPGQWLFSGSRKTNPGVVRKPPGARFLTTERQIEGPATAAGARPPLLTMGSQATRPPDLS